MITLIAALAVSPSTVVETLGNGVTLVAVHVPEARTFSAQTFVRAGSAYEAVDQSGVTHLLEHLLFVDGAADSIAENSGLLLNATTFREFMRLHTVGPAESWKAGIQSVARLLNQPTGASTAAEWAVIGQENALAQLDPDEMANRALWKEAADGSSWQQSPMGDVARDEPKGVDIAYSRYVVGANIVAVAVGSIPSSEVLVEMRASYLRLPTGPALAPPPLPKWKVSSVTIGSRYGIGVSVPGYDEPIEYLAAEIALEAITSPARLSPLGLEAKRYLTPSSKGSYATVSFRAMDGAPGLSTRVRQAIAVPVSESELADARARCKRRYTSNQPTNRALPVGLSILLAGKTIDFGAEIDRVPRRLIDEFLAGIPR